MNNQLLKTLRNSKLLKNVDISKLNLESLTGRLISLGEGEILYRASDPANSMFIIVSGEMNLLAKDENGSTGSSTYRDNEYFGLEEIVASSNRKSTAVALRDSYLIEFSRDEFKNLLAQEPGILSNANLPLSGEGRNNYLQSLGIKMDSIEKEDEESIFEDDSEDEEVEESSEITTEDFKKRSYESEAVIDQYESSPPEYEEDSLTKDLLELNSYEEPEQEELEEEQADQTDIEKDTAEQSGEELAEDSESSQKEQEDSTGETSGEKQSEEDDDFFAGLDEDFNLEEFEDFDREEEQPEENETEEPETPEAEGEEEEPEFEVKKDEESGFELPELPEDYTEETSDTDTETSDNKGSEELKEEKKSSGEIGSDYEELDEDDTETPGNATEEREEQETLNEEAFDTDETEEVDKAEESSKAEEPPSPAETEESDEEYPNDIPYFLSEDYEDTAFKGKDEESEERAPQDFETGMVEKGEPDETDLLKIFEHLKNVNTSLRLEDLSEDIIETAAEICNADKGFIFHMDLEKSLLKGRIKKEDSSKTINIPIGEGIIGWAGKVGKIVNVLSAADDKRYNEEYDNLEEDEANSMLCYPVKDHENNVMAVLALVKSNEGKFDSRDEQLLEIFMKVAAVSLENARHVDALLSKERIASLGKMTNLLVEDVKKPVLISKRYTEHLLKKDLEKDIHSILEMMQEQLESVGDVVQTVSSYSEGKTMLRSINISLNELLDDFKQRVKYFVENNNCRLIGDYGDEVSVNVDIREIFQAYENIIKNAVESMEEGGDIRISTEMRGDFVAIIFTDRGIGIPSEVLNKIYEPFMSHGKAKNTGLGLSIANKIVDAHNGELKIESEVGAGTKVSIILPIAENY